MAGQQRESGRAAARPAAQAPLAAAVADQRRRERKRPEARLERFERREHDPRALLARLDGSREPVAPGRWNSPVAPEREGRKRGRSLQFSFIGSFRQPRDWAWRARYYRDIEIKQLECVWVRGSAYGMEF